MSEKQCPARQALGIILRWCDMNPCAYVEQAARDGLASLSICNCEEPIPARQHSDASWSRRVAELEAENERLRTHTGVPSDPIAETAYLLGQIACMAGKGLIDNPFKFKSFLWPEWERGWKAKSHQLAKRESEGGKS